IANDLQKVGVRLVPRGNERAIHIHRRLAGTLAPAFYDTFPYYPTLDASLVMDFFGLQKTETLTPTYDDEDFDSVYRLTTRADQPRETPLDALGRSRKTLADTPPVIFLSQPVQVHALAKPVADFAASTDLLIDFDRIRREY